ncbi:MAG: hypothetical protein IJE05_01725 [Clostridia bacterium]|nr:hypothetical protein [Clostridia bacterium]
MEENEKAEVVLEFQKTGNGISVVVHECSILDVVVGIAETIELIMENSDATKESVFEDINKVLEVLKKEEEK